MKVLNWSSFLVLAHHFDFLGDILVWTAWVYLLRWDHSNIFLESGLSVDNEDKVEMIWMSKVLCFDLEDHFFVLVPFSSFCGTLGLRGLAFYNSGIILLFVQCLVDYHLGVRLSLSVLSAPHRFLNHWVLFLFRDVRLFGRMCHFPDRLSWVIVSNEVAISRRVDCQSCVGRCHRTLFRHIRWVLLRNREVISC